MAEFWAVMKAYPLSAIEAMTPLGPVPLEPPRDGPSRFIPLFDTYEQAVAWNGGCTDHIVRMGASGSPPLEVNGGQDDGK